jgi:predicted nucleotidyltransferase
MIDDTKIIQLTELLRAAAMPKKIILFGSQAREKADALSDLDILIVEHRVKNRVAEMVRLNRVVSPLRVPVDLLVVSEEAYAYWSSTPGNVYYHARTQGKTLYEAA